MMNEIDVMNVIRRVIRQWLLILLCGLTVSMLYAVVSARRYHPVYQTTATVVVAEGGIFGNGVYTASKTADTFQEIISSNLLQQRVASAIGRDSIPGSISCSKIPETNMITLTARASTPQDAMITIHGVLDNYQEIVDQLLKNTIMIVVESPKAPDSPTEIYNEWSVLMKGFLMGIAFACAGLAALFAFTDDIKNENDIERKLDTKLLGTVYHEKKRKKTGLLVTNPVTSFGFSETFQKISTKIEHKVGRKDSDKDAIILISSVEENEGKSTIAANIALSLASRGKKVALLDMDLRKPAQNKLFNLRFVNDEGTLSNLLENPVTAKDYLRRIPDTSLDVIATDRGFENPVQLLSLPSTNKLVQDLAKEFDYLIIDSPPVFAGVDTEILMQIAEYGILVVRQNHSLSKDINDAVDSYRKYDCSLLGCVFNDYQTGLFSNSMVGANQYDRRYGYGYGNYGRYGRYKSYSNYYGRKAGEESES